jgi:hypothetical protein
MKNDFAQIRTSHIELHAFGAVGLDPAVVSR